MANPRVVTERKNIDVTSETGRVASPQKSSQKSINKFKTEKLLVNDQTVLSAKHAIANKISENSQQAEEIDKTKYNDVLRDYNTQAAQNNCKGQCHGYKAGFEEEKEFNSRMKKMSGLGKAGKGHALTYRESNWLWKFGKGEDMHVDGKALKSLEVPGRYMASPFPRLDDLKVHGSVSLNNNGEIQDGRYDFNDQNVRWYDAVGHIRNYLNNQAIEEHGEGQSFMIKYDYGNNGNAK